MTWHAHGGRPDRRERIDAYKRSIAEGLGDEALVAIRGSEVVRLVVTPSAHDQVVEALREIGFVSLTPA
jgi:hypothetical protein